MPDYVRIYISDGRHGFRETYESLDEKHPNYKPTYEESTHNLRYEKSFAEDEL